jgi:hypothetical protein
LKRGAIFFDPPYFIALDRVTLATKTHKHAALSPLDLLAFDKFSMLETFARYKTKVVCSPYLQFSLFF